MPLLFSWQIITDFVSEGDAAAGAGGAGRGGDDPDEQGVAVEFEESDEEDDDDVDQVCEQMIVLMCLSVPVYVSVSVPSSGNPQCLGAVNGQALSI